MKITAVVVTYNRLELLKECIAAIGAQTQPPSAVLVVNNGSTDGTEPWLRTQAQLRFVTQENKGGAWGFYTGVREGYATGADWLWLMDDDTIPRPEALEALVRAAQSIGPDEDRFGFFGSKVEWTDGSLHLMNKQQHHPGFRGKKTYDEYAARGLFPVIYNSFVSLLVSREAIEQCGLPIKEFFIWNDDIEYTERLLQAGFAGALVEDSVVLHKTPVNNASNLFTDSKSNLWKYRYGLRNELYTRRHKKGYGSYVRNLMKRFFIMPFKIAARRKSDRWPFIKMVWQASWNALSFDPPKEFVERRDRKEELGRNIEQGMSIEE
ncbi:MAG TPA: glycosyltransferase family 2 protein [Chitinophagaceae bacterium]|jgi:GT2 family glycosyltransferase|nr:glycosyltransferase family 2 protein [Chitinophagaceae bacterium]